MSQGIKETKEVVEFIKLLIKVVYDAKSDGSVNLLDLPKLLALVPLAAPAFMGVNEIPQELKDLDLVEANELVEYIKKDLMVSDAKAKQIIEVAFKIVLAGFEMFLLLKPGPELLPAT